MRLSAPALSKRKLPSQSRRTRCSKPGHSALGPWPDWLLLGLCVAIVYRYCIVLMASYGLWLMAAVV